ncbi:MAG: hypothetical protein PWR27_1564 [Petroclostridium sp.]|jgi:diguanylate cyclase (GGDEF)-like protein|uniref:GGDEF domain-containing protein n=1 Tax=Petroclostridium xylanilyticum TaxID=1792311 RepID=UPI000B98624F|nr:GGDEF domain-containing protein [Petroclostridium xylanilyticum]MBZ4645510.1 diguanylate cyclase [Clostridia bacterium]MDK2810855.1 hypothetical protein [Petroclostridium sp.]
MIIDGIMTRQPLTIDILSGVKKAEQIMRDNKIGGLPVVENGRLVGIITSRDIRQANPNRIIADVMSRNVIVLEPHNTLWEAKELMEKYDIERLVIVDKERIVGILTKMVLYTEIGKYTDNLTGMYKKEYLLSKASMLLKNNKPFSFIFIDIDKFGQMNKDFGHETCDKIIIQISNLLQMYENLNTWVCRFGGDEFVLLLDGNKVNAIHLAKEIINEFKFKKWINNLEVLPSIGIAFMDAQSKRDCSSEHNFIITQLLNNASLASTTAKKLPEKYTIVEC